MSIKTYSIKDIADMTYLPITKIRSLIKKGVIKAEMNEAICGKRKCKRLEATEEDLIDFACKNPELAGPMLDIMKIVKNHTTSTDTNIDNSSENYDDCNIPDTPFIAFDGGEANPESEEIGEDTDKTEPDQKFCSNNDSINELKSEKDRMIDDLTQIRASFEWCLERVNIEIQTITDRLEDLNRNKEWYNAKISSISLLIDHITKNC